MPAVSSDQREAAAIAYQAKCKEGTLPQQEPSRQMAQSMS